jgi:GTP-binding protein
MAEDLSPQQRDSKIADKYDFNENNKFSKEQLEAGRLLFSSSCDFMLGVAALDGLPPSNLREIAFAGRSNVGKSSLMNALARRKDLARTSNTPGRTQELNYFNLADQFYLVDMPGYGYAKVSKTTRDKCNRLIKGYLRGRQTLRTVFILVDGRHGLKESDEELMNMLDETAVSYRLIFTKCDKAKKAELKKYCDDILAKSKNHPAMYPEFYFTSSIKNQGLDILRAAISVIE